MCLLLSTAETCTPQRKGLRSSALRPKRPEPGKQDGPIIIETWVPEEDLHLWEIRAFAERYVMWTLTNDWQSNAVITFSTYL